MPVLFFDEQDAGVPEGQCEDQAASAVHVRSDVWWWLLPMSSVIQTICSLQGCLSPSNGAFTETWEQANNKPKRPKETFKSPKRSEVFKSLLIIRAEHHDHVFIDLKLLKVDNTKTVANKKKT